MMTWQPLSGAIVALLLLGGCQSTVSAVPTPGPWAANVKAAQSEATTDFERQALADGVVSEQEYAEAAQRLIECAKARGVTVVQTQRSGRPSGWSGAGSPTFDQVFDDCTKGNTAVLEPIYFGMRDNPLNEDPMAKDVACLKRAGLVPESYTVSDFQRDLDPQKLPFDTESDAAKKCLIGD